MARGKIEKRGQRRRKIKPVILIVTEGSQTEPKYFEHYRNRQTNIDIRVVGSRTSGGETDYLSLIRKAVWNCCQSIYQHPSAGGITAIMFQRNMVGTKLSLHWHSPALSP